MPLMLLSSIIANAVLRYMFLFYSEHVRICDNSAGLPFCHHTYYVPISLAGGFVQFLLNVCSDFCSTTCADIIRVTTSKCGHHVKVKNP